MPIVFYSVFFSKFKNTLVQLHLLTRKVRNLCCASKTSNVTNKEHSQLLRAAPLVCSRACISSHPPEPLLLLLHNLSLMSKQRTCVGWVSQLHRLLDDGLHPQILGWIENGKAFQIYNKLAFVQTVLPLVGKPQQYQSFLRKLFRYGFARVVGNWDVFAHPQFQQCCPHLLSSVLTQWREGGRTAYLDVQVRSTYLALMPCACACFVHSYCTTHSSFTSCNTTRTALEFAHFAHFAVQSYTLVQHYLPCFLWL